MEFLLLGPVELRVASASVPLGGTKQRALVAILALHSGEVVSRERLVDGLWGELPPASATHTVESYVSRLRRILREHGEDDLLRTRSPGYALALAPAQLDVRRFEGLARQGRGALARGDPAEAGRLLRDALDLFRGPPLDDVGFLPFAAAPQARLTEERLAVLDDRIEADLATGRAGELIGELHALAEAHPLRERTHGQLMLALYRVGRQSDALAAYQRARTLLGEELGVAPGPQLRTLEEQILRQEPQLHGPVTTGSRWSRSVGAVVGAAGTPGGHGAEPSGDRPVVDAPPSSRPPPRARRLAQHRMWVAVPTFAVLALVLATTWSRDDSGRGAGPAAVPASSLGILDPLTGTTRASVHIGAAPRALAAGSGAVWVADPATDTVRRVDPTSHRIVDEIPLKGEPDALAVGGGSVWVAEELAGRVVRIAPTTDTVVQSVTVGHSPTNLAYGHGKVWVAAAGDRTLIDIDARTGAVHRHVTLDSAPTSVAYGLGAVWVTSASSGALYRVGPGHDDVVRIPVGTAPGAVAVLGSAVWVANTLDGTVSRIDPASNVVTATVVTGTSPTSIAGETGSLWVADEAAGTITRVDSASAVVTRTVHLAAAPVSVAASPDGLWVTTGRSFTAHRGGTLRVAAAIPRLDSIDPGVAFLLFPPQLLGMTNDGLVTLAHVPGSGGTQLVPDLATTIPVPTHHGLTYRFVLRPGIRYSDGTPVRPGDVRRAIERDFVIGSPGRGFYTGIVGATRCLQVVRRCDLSRGIVVNRGDRSITFRLDRPDADFLYQLTLTFADAVPAGTPFHDIGRHPLPATGPYVIRRYDPGHSLLLTRNPYFRPWSRPAQPDGFPDRIRWRFGFSPDGAVTAIERARADWGLYPFPFSPPGARLRDLRVRYPAQVHVSTLPETEFFALDTRRPPFDDIRVRRALNDAVDRNRLVRLYGGSSLATATCQPLPPALPGYRRYCPYSRGASPAGPYRGPRIGEARRLVAESGTAGARVRIVADAHFPPASYVASVLRRLGYRARVTVATGHRLDVLESNSRFGSQVNQGGWAADYPSPAEFIDHFLSCRSFQPHSDANVNTAEFCSHRVDAGIAAAEALQRWSPRSAARAWARVDRRVTDLAPWLPTVNLDAVDFVSRRVGGYESNPQWGVLLDQLWVR